MSHMEDHQSPEEIESQYRPEGPVIAAQDFLTLLVEQEDLRAAWPLVDPALRLALVQSWLWANRYHPYAMGCDRDEVAEALSQEDPDHELWDDFEEIQLDVFLENPVWASYASETFGAASRPRPVGPDMEIVLFMDTGGEAIVIEKPTFVEGIQLLMRYDASRWRVRGFNAEVLPMPGWPPKEL